MKKTSYCAITILWSHSHVSWPYCQALVKALDTNRLLSKQPETYSWVNVVTGNNDPLWP